MAGVGEGVLAGILEDHMKRHSRPQFNKLANAFNRHFHGTIQPKGQRYVFIGKKNDGVFLFGPFPFWD
jgi:hypothetical protein